MKEVLNFPQKLKEQEKFAKENREIISMNHGARVKVLPGEKIESSLLMALMAALLQLFY
jgi:hypothetical protein